MIIPINVVSSSSNEKLPPGLANISHEEVVLIELQGSLEVECTNITESDGKLIGKLKIDEVSNKPTLLIGHHLLEGQITTLTKPIAVLHRKSALSSRRADSGKENHDSDKQMNVDENESSASVEWDVIAVVKRKIIFSKRPMPIVGRGAI